VESPFFIKLFKAIVKEYGSGKYGRAIWDGNQQEAENLFGGMATEAIEVKRKIEENDPTQKRI